MPPMASSGTRRGCLSAIGLPTDRINALDICLSVSQGLSDWGGGAPLGQMQCENSGTTPGNSAENAKLGDLKKHP